MLEARPILGFGWATYPTEVQPYYRLSSSYPLTAVGAIHNVFLGNMVALGIVGSALWMVGLFLGVGAPLCRRGPPGERQLWWTALLGVAVCWFAVGNFTPQEYAFANAVLWLLAGIVTAFDGAPTLASGRSPGIALNPVREEAGA